MQVNAGEAVTILRPSGSGKSTCSDCLPARTSRVRPGFLLRNDLGAWTKDARAALRASRVGFVFQSFQLLPGMTALENVALPLQIGRRRSARSQAEALLA